MLIAVLTLFRGPLGTPPGGGEALYLDSPSLTMISYEDILHYVCSVAPITMQTPHADEHNNDGGLGLNNRRRRPPFHTHITVSAYK